MHDGGEYLTSVNTLLHTLIDKKEFVSWMCIEDSELKIDLRTLQHWCAMTSKLFNS